MLLEVERKKGAKGIGVLPVLWPMDGKVVVVLVRSGREEGSGILYGRQGLLSHATIEVLALLA